LLLSAEVEAVEVGARMVAVVVVVMLLELFYHSNRIPHHRRRLLIVVVVVSYSFLRFQREEAPQELYLVKMKIYDDDDDDAAADYDDDSMKCAVWLFSHSFRVVSVAAAAAVV
jgi:hypothetical protein